MDAETRGALYKLLSRCYHLPDERIFAHMTELKEALNGVYPEAVELLADVSNEIDVEQLKVDFSRLFVGPFKLLAPPYGSVYLESGRRLMGDSTIDARNHYREAGLDFSDELKEAPDHIAFELEFMYYLIFNEHEAVSGSDRETVRAYLHKQRQFLNDHLGAWVSEFTAKVEENATTEFYKILAKITRTFVQEDRAALLKLSIIESDTK